MLRIKLTALAFLLLVSASSAAKVHAAPSATGIAASRGKAGGNGISVPELDPAPASSAIALLIAAGFALQGPRRRTAA